MGKNNNQRIEENLCRAELQWVENTNKSKRPFQRKVIEGEKVDGVAETSQPRE